MCNVRYREIARDPLWERVLNVSRIFAGCLLLCIIAARCSGVPQHEQIATGQSMREIRSLLGEPDSIDTSIKIDQPIWGPEESFWDVIPAGTSLERWRYDLRDGTLNLYFVDGSDTLGYKAFAPKGVVYESAPG